MTTAPPEGWYPDPQGIADERYFDGSEWTDRTRQEQAEVGTATAVPVSVNREWGAALASSAGRVASVADVFAWLFLLIGALGAGIIAITAISAVSDYRSPLNDLWPYALVGAAILLANAVVVWLLFRFISIVAGYVSLRSKSMSR